MPLIDYLAVSEVKILRLARKTGIGIDRLKALSRGEDATASELMKLSNTFGVGVSDLVRKEVDPHGAEYRFRAAANRSATAQGVRQKTINEIATRIDGIDELIERHDVAVQAWAAPEGLRNDPFALAAWFRESCLAGDQVSPVLSLAKTLDSCLGIVTVVLHRSDVDGVSAVVKDTAYIFIRAQFKPRMLFTLAHELGHLLAHSCRNDFASIDPIGSVSRRAIGHDEERFANDFASELLMPQAGVGVALREIRDAYANREQPIGDIEILLLSHIFGVSFEAAARRCEQLELLPRGGSRALVVHVSKEFGSPERRAAHVGIPVRPEPEFPIVSEKVLRAAAEAVASGNISIGRVMDRLHVTYEDLLAQRRSSEVERYH